MFFDTNYEGYKNIVDCENWGPTRKVKLRLGSDKPKTRSKAHHKRVSKMAKASRNKNRK